jgi:hypothetical protein
VAMWVRAATMALGMGVAMGLSPKGPQGQWDHGVTVSGTDTHRNTQAHRHTGTQAHRHTGTQAHRHTGTQAQTHTHTRARRHTQAHTQK